ncbi:type II secretion system protein N [Endozoicomonas gorgoniicola]|uniref:Type II secretion system protein N n=1 Tax=Endozoicomonas gorgoniicola TaxID=1234144 RepID=A0ABT3N2X1_9GAMM|nr:type II secretion system protein N [Endozoicomonas gorgoniicola]MCW7555979.1 type II secretion system protein N [Endozoicomonas gorgoniicola]
MKIKKIVGLTFTGLLAWAFFLVVNLPAAFVYQMAPVPDNVSASNISGTLWSGQAGEVTVNNVTLTSVNWDIKPSALLGQAIEADITVGDLQSPVSAEATVRATTSEVSLTDTTVDVSAQWLQSRFPMPDFVAVDVLGNINLDVQAMSFTEEGCQNLNGLVALQRSRLNSPFGGVRLGDAGARLSCEAGTLTASVNQSSSDIATEGQFTLRPNMSFNLAATLTPGEELPDQMKQGLAFLGQPEGDNAYSLRFSGRL